MIPKEGCTYWCIRHSDEAARYEDPHRNNPPRPPWYGKLVREPVRPDVFVWHLYPHNCETNVTDRSSSARTFIGLVDDPKPLPIFEDLADANAAYISSMLTHIEALQTEVAEATTALLAYLSKKDQQSQEFENDDMWYGGVDWSRVPFRATVTRAWPVRLPNGTMTVNGGQISVGQMDCRNRKACVTFDTGDVVWLSWADVLDHTDLKR